MNKKISRQMFINQWSYICEAGFEYLIALLTSGAFLATLLSYNGVSDKTTGIITSLSAFSFIAQAASVLFIHPKNKGKKMIVVLHTLNQLMFVFLYMTPFINVSLTIKTIIFIIMYLGGNILSNVAMPFKIGWMNSYVEDEKRGAFTAKKEIISLSAGIIFSYIMGGISDYFTNLGKPDTAFILCGITMLVLCILHTASMIAIKDDKNEQIKEETKSSSYKFRDILKITVLDKNYSKIIFLSVICSFSTGLLVPYLGTYQISELGFSLTFIATITMIGNIARISMSDFFGKFADRHSWAKMLSIVFLIAGASFLCIVFSTPSTGKIMYTLHIIMYSIYYAGFNSGMMNVAFDYVRHEDRAAALGIKAAFAGVSSFIASLIGAEVVDFIQSNGNTLFGLTIYAQQILAFIAALIQIAIFIYIRKVIFKMKKII